MQGHVVHIVGMGEGWGRELPGLVGARGDGGREVGSGVKEERKEGEREGEKMKIAWRYERLGEVGGSRGGSALAFLLLMSWMYISGNGCDQIVQCECYMGS